MKTCYTVILGNYDTLRQPEVITPGWRYVCITDTPEICNGTVYEPFTLENIITPLDYMAKFEKWALGNNVAFQKDEKRIYHDGSFQVIGNLDEYIEPFKNAAFATRKHPSRKDYAEELNACLEAGKITQTEAANIICHLMEDLDQHPKGLWENGLLYFSAQPDSSQWGDIAYKILYYLAQTTRDQILLPIFLDNEMEPALIDREHAKQFFKWYPHN